MRTTSHAGRVERYTCDEKYRQQVDMALKNLTENTGCMLKLDELLRTPGAGMLKPIFQDAMDAQQNEALTMQQAIEALKQLVNEADMNDGEDAWQLVDEASL